MGSRRAEEKMHVLLKIENGKCLQLYVCVFSLYIIKKNMGRLPLQRFKNVLKTKKKFTILYNGEKWLISSLNEGKGKVEVIMN
jgi:hypothetical protein